ncbi:MAG: VTT domain-containing protein [Candidatus Pacebacteria bacterium]|nr:VTT domain-containing protein [Candidatus Paceibacterota bacterium]
MVENIILWIESIIKPWGMLGVFIGSSLEEIIAPIPSLFMQLSYGVLLYANTPTTTETVLKFFITMPVFAALGVVVGSLPYFLLSKYVGVRFIKKFGRFLGLGRDPYAKVQEFLNKQTFDEKFLVFGRLIPMVPSIIIAILPGFFGVSVRNYIIFSFIGAYIRCAALGFVGWQLGRSYLVYIEKIQETQSTWGPIFLILILLVVLFYLRRKSKKLNT